MTNLGAIQSSLEIDIRGTLPFGGDNIVVSVGDNIMVIRLRCSRTGIRMRSACPNSGFVHNILPLSSTSALPRNYTRLLTATMPRLIAVKILAPDNKVL
jgi:hypothetical protein